MPTYNFSVVSAGQLCLTAGSGMYTIKRKDATGKYSAFIVSGKPLSVGSMNTCATLLSAGDYLVDYTKSAIRCSNSVAPAFTYTEGAGVPGGGADGVVTGMTFSGGVLTLTRSNGLPALTATIPAGATMVTNPDGSLTFNNGVDPATTIPAGIDPNNVASLENLLTKLKDSFGYSVVDAFGNEEFFGFNL